MDRNITRIKIVTGYVVALRKESVDRNVGVAEGAIAGYQVALRKESVDRNSS